LKNLIHLSTKIGKTLKDNGNTVAVAETSAGGLLSASLLAIPGASAYFLGGGVIYTQESRRILLNLHDSEMVGIRSSSQPYAKLLATTIQNSFGSTWGISETGAAGPTGNRYGDNAGHTCIAVSGPVSEVITLETESNEREKNMEAFALAALKLFEKCLTKI
jgi:nicotinamide-nucleotide amidase|tara:strand:+ start:2670 stop:3155 length:486 start_codon:yes stop_codon:yes gene_type:complete